MVCLESEVLGWATQPNAEADDLKLLRQAG